MLWTLVRKELLSNLLTMRLAVALAFTVVLSLMTVFIGSDEYSRNTDRYEQARKDAAEELAQATVWRDVEPEIFLPPQPLSILCRGLSESAGSSRGLNLNFNTLTFGPITGADSDLMRSLVRIDFTTVVALLLSFLAVVLGYDGICGERESGTLQLLMTNAVPRITIVAAKLLGGLLSLWTPLALAFTVVLLILLANPDVHFAGEDWVRLILFFVLSCVFLGQIFAFSLAISAWTRDSATSLIVCLFFWLLAGIGWANVLPSLTRYGVDEPPFQEFIDQNDELWEEYNAIQEEWEEQHPGLADIYFTGREGAGPDRYEHPKGYEWRAQRNADMLPKALEFSDRRFRFWKTNQQPLYREGGLVDIWGVLSPLVNYQVLAYQLARTTVDDNLYAGESGTRYRETYFDWLRGRGVFGDRRWFTDDPLDQEPLIPDPEALTEAERQPHSEYMKARRAWMEQQEERAANDDTRQLDLTDIPKFGGEHARRDLAASLGVMARGLLVLGATAVVAAILLLWRFATYEPGR